VRDDVNGLPELWNIDRLADYLSVSKPFVYRPLLSPGVRLRANGGGHHQLTGRAGPGGSATARIVRHSRPGRRGTTREAQAATAGTYGPPNRRAHASQRLVGEMDGTRQAVGSTRARGWLDPGLPDRTGVREGETGRTGPVCAVARSPGRPPTWLTTTCNRFTIR
jgi:hypothetical protein